MGETNIKKEYICNICNKEYKDKSGLWYHNKKYHNDINPKTTLVKGILTSNNLKVQPVVEQKQIFKCKFCDTTFTRKNNLNQHIKKTCKEKNSEIEKLKAEIREIKEKFSKEIDKLKNKQTKIIYNGPVSNNTNNIINICKIGNEDINMLTTNEVNLIKSHGLNAVITIADCTNFNQRLPQNHNFYTSALNDKHINTLDHKTNTIIKQPKVEVFDKVLVSSIDNLEKLGKNDEHFMEKVDRLKKFIFLKKTKKKYYEQLNLLSYNKGKMIASTWEKLIKDNNITPDEFSSKLDEEVKQITEMTEEECTSDSELSSDSDSDYDGIKLVSTKVEKNIEL